MINHRIRKTLPFGLGQWAVRSIIAPIILLFSVMTLPALSGAQQVCQPNGDIDRNGSVTAADALLAFQQALGLAPADYVPTGHRGCLPSTELSRPTYHRV